MKEDWYIDNKECINKQRVRLTDEERIQKCNENSKEYYYNNSEKMKKYRKKNKEEKKEYDKQYYLKKREKYRNEKIK